MGRAVVGHPATAPGAMRRLYGDELVEALHRETSAIIVAATTMGQADDRDVHQVVGHQSEPSAAVTPAGVGVASANVNASKRVLQGLMGDGGGSDEPPAIGAELLVVGGPGRSAAPDPVTQGMTMRYSANLAGLTPEVLRRTRFSWRVDFDRSTAPGSISRVQTGNIRLIDQMWDVEGHHRVTCIVEHFPFIQADGVPPMVAPEARHELVQEVHVVAMAARKNEMLAHAQPMPPALEYASRPSTMNDVKATGGTEAPDPDHAAKLGSLIDKIQPGKVQPLQAVYVNLETGNSMQLPLYGGPAKETSSYNTMATDMPSVVDLGYQFILLDLSPGAKKRETEGGTARAAIEQFARNNEYPQGSITVVVPGTGEKVEIKTSGQSTWAAWSASLNLASMGLFAAGAVAAVGTGGMIVPILYGAGLVASAASSVLDVMDAKDEAEVDNARIAVDALNLASDLVIGGSMELALRSPEFVSVAGRRYMQMRVAIAGATAVLVAEDYVPHIRKSWDDSKSTTQNLMSCASALMSIAAAGGMLMWSAIGLRKMNKTGDGGKPQ